MMKNIKKFEDYNINEKAKNLVKANIPESLYKILFKKNILLNNDVEFIKLKNKNEVKEILKNEGNIDIIGFNDSNDFVYVKNDFWIKKYYITIYKNNISNNELLPISLLMKYFLKDYKFYKIINNHKQVNRKKKSIGHNEKFYDFVTEYHKKYLIKKFIEFRTEIIDDIDLTKYRLHGDVNEDIDRKMSAIGKLNNLLATLNSDEEFNIGSYHNEVIVNSTSYILNKLFKHFEENSYGDILSKKDLNNTISKIVSYWEIEDFHYLNDHNKTRKIITRKDKIKKQTRKFKI